MRQQVFPRRHIIGLGAGAVAALALPRLALGQELPPTPECGTDPKATIAQTEGPFFKPKSPLRSDLRAELKGTPVMLTGFVLTRECRPVPNALVDLWHADADGEYDNRGFRGRGHQFTDAQGRYRFVTVKPARYTGRTAHYHVRVQAANRPVLTTQLYFPGEPGNRRDGLYRRELEMTFSGASNARFDFVLGGA
ncbi:MAG: intradiol ring-cleavage dioxygenase [Pseudorhodoplanes sp.]|uniref:dioxygenase family protein n=1 Tax=Pseudorhodoplanes sp. TaxID=1934341 RepID=UPI003D11D837